MKNLVELSKNLMRSSPEGFSILQSRFLLAAAQAADSFGMFRQSFVPEDLIERAQKEVGSSDFGDWSFREPLDVLLKAYEEEAT